MNKSISGSLAIGALVFTLTQLSFADQKSTRDVTFADDQKHIIKYEIERGNVRALACTILDLNASKNQLSCQRLFESSIEEFNLMTSCLQDEKIFMQSGAGQVGVAAGAGGIIYGLHKYFEAYAARPDKWLEPEMATSATGSILGVATVFLEIGYTNYTSSELKGVKQKLDIYNPANTVDRDAYTSLSYTQYVSTTQKSMEYNFWRCDLKPELTYELTPSYYSFVLDKDAKNADLEHIKSQLQHQASIDENFKKFGVK